MPPPPPKLLGRGRSKGKSAIVSNSVRWQRSSLKVSYFMDSTIRKGQNKLV